MKPFRLEKFGSEVRQIVSDAIRNQLQDPRVSPMTSVTRVELSSDLEWAKVHVSVLGGESDQRKTLAGLKSASGFIQKLLARELHARQCPHLSFHLDESIAKANEVMHIIQKSMTELAGDVARRVPDPPADGPSARGAAG